jgi:hypothetical protein
MWVLYVLGIALVAGAIISSMEDARLQGYRDKFTGRQKHNRE